MRELGEVKAKYPLKKKGMGQRLEK